METNSAAIEPVTMSEVLELATWNRQRTSDELREFINTHHDSRLDDISLE